MKHRVAREYLTEFAAGSLEAGARASVASHVEGCDICHEWLDTYGLLATALCDPTAQDTAHPDSEILAICTVRPEEIYEQDRAELLEHIENCDTCSRQMEVVRAATVAARPGRRTTWQEWTHGPRAVARWSVLAAGLAALSIGSVLFFQQLPSLAGRQEAGRPGKPTLTSVQPSHEVSHRVLSLMEFDGDRVIEAGETLTVANVNVNSGAQVTFRAGQRVALGDGFQVGAGARLTIELSGPEPGPLGEIQEAQEFSRK